MKIDRRKLKKSSYDSIRLPLGNDFWKIACVIYELDDDILI